MRRYAADLHVHTALSPCADEAMSPPRVVLAAMDAGLDIIAICDHNTAGNVAAAQEVAEGPGEGRVLVIPGIEITTAEEVHVVALFPNADTAMCASEVILAGFPCFDRDSRRYGRQLIMNGDGDIVGEEPRILSAASQMPLAEAVAFVRGNGGLAIAAHVDRPSFSVGSQLGFFPPDVHFDAIEISTAGLAQGRDAEFRALGLPVVTGSDSHSLELVGASRSYCYLETAAFHEIAAALRGAGGRSVGLA